MNGPNGHPPRPTIPIMSPKERMVWLAAHRAEPHYRLLTTAELAIMQNQLNRAAVYETEFRETVKQLDAFGYWEGKPDVKTACADAAFDARRYERATSAAVERLETSVAFFRSMLSKAIGPTEAIDLINEVSALATCLEFLKAQSEAKRMDIKPEGT